MKIIFAGTPDFSVPSLDALVAAGHEILAVYTQPDRPAGRGRHLTTSPVKQAAQKYHIPVYQPVTLRNPAEIQQISDFQADLMVVVAYGLILPQAVLDATRYGCLNVHPSLLPRWRGAAPIARTIEAGDKVTGITIMQMDAGLDSGDILSQSEYPLTGHETSASLEEIFAIQGARLLVKTIANLNQCTQQRQDENTVTYANKISRHEAEINWSHSASLIHRKIRAFNPRPVAFTFLQGNVLRIWEASVLPEKILQPSGTILHADAKGIDVATGNGILRLEKIQLAGGKILSVADVLNARREAFSPGKILG